MAYGFRTVSQLGIGYRAARPSRRAVRHWGGARGPGTGSPTRASSGEGQPSWLGQTLAEPRSHLLACGPVGRWDVDRPAALDRRHPDLLAVHH